MYIPAVGLSQDQWAELITETGMPDYRRSYDHKIPVKFFGGSGHSVHLSGKGHASEVANGIYDNAFAAVAKGMRPGDRFTWYHEPENNMSGVQFKSAFRRVYKVMKYANPYCQVGQIMTLGSFWPNSPTAKRIESYWVYDEYTDFLGVDGYNGAGAVDNNGKPRPWKEAEELFNPYITWMKENSDKPGVITECGSRHGITGPNGETQATWIYNAWHWAKRHQLDLYYWSAREFTLDTVSKEALWNMIYERKTSMV